MLFTGVASDEVFNNDASSVPDSFQQLQTPRVRPLEVDKPNGVSEKQRHAGRSLESSDVFATYNGQVGEVVHLPGPGQQEGATGAVEEQPDAAHDKKLGQWMATAICGNDITSSTFYVTGLAVASGGVWAFICMLLVAATLRLFCSIYGEAITALPLNGGAYNVLLNTTSKKAAAVAACLSILSYMATAVVSAGSAIAYLQYIYPAAIVHLGTCLLMVCVAALCLWGITESGRVALLIFTFHIATLTVLVITIIVYLGRNGATAFSHNIDIYASYNPPPVQALVFGFAAATLGVSGFETSANFVEEQADGVFVKTLRNMWAVVAFFNPMLALLAVLLFTVEYIAADANINVTLALLAEVCGGEWLKYWVSVDAFIVLSGAVLTGFVGVTGLARRLAMDGCLPQLLLKTNRWRGTNHYIILGFLLICVTLYLVLNGDVTSLANVYSVSFLCVMSLFAIGNMLLKYKRGELQRQVRASWGVCLLGLALVLIALVGVIVHDTSVLTVWLLYFVIVVSLFSIMFLRTRLLRLTYHSLQSISRNLRAVAGQLGAADLGERWFRDGPALNYLLRSYHQMASQSVAFFIESGSLASLNKAVLYCRENEETQHIHLVHVHPPDTALPEKLQQNVQVLDEEYPRIKVDLVIVDNTHFSPEAVGYISRELQVPRNRMFMECPKSNFKEKATALGGVRIIAK